MKMMANIVIMLSINFQDARTPNFLKAQNVD